MGQPAKSYPARKRAGYTQGDRVTFALLPALDSAALSRYDQRRIDVEI
jgi:hypothetical protein